MNYKPGTGKVPPTYCLTPLPMQAPFQGSRYAAKGAPWTYVQESAHLTSANLSCLSHHKNNIQWQLYEKIFFKPKNHFLKIKWTYLKHINASVQLNAEKGLPTYTLSSFIDIGSSWMGTKILQRRTRDSEDRGDIRGEISITEDSKLHYLWNSTQFWISRESNAFLQSYPTIIRSFHCT